MVCLFFVTVLVFGDIFHLLLRAVCFIVLYGLTELFFFLGYYYYLSDIPLTGTPLTLNASNPLQGFSKGT